MNPLLQELFNDIRNMIKMHHQLVELAEQQRIALINGDHDRLQTLIPKIEEAASETAEIEQHRVHLTDKIAKDLGLNPGEVTAATFISVLDADTGAQLRLLSEQLKQVVAELMQANERNAMLTKFSIDYTHKVLEMVAGLSNRDTYGPSKKTQAGARILNLEA